MRRNDSTLDHRDSNRAAARLASWTVAWVAALAVARIGPELVWDSRPASWVAVTVTVLAGAAWLVAFMRFLRTVDDLWRTIVHDALAATLGVGSVAGFAYVVADGAGLVAGNLTVAAFAAFLGAVYLITVLAGWIRYR